MKRFLMGFAVAVTAMACSSPSHAGFTVNAGPASGVIELGTFTVGETTVNAFDGSGNLVVSPDSWNYPAGFTSTIAAGTYQVALVQATTGAFSVTSDTAIIGVVASNGWRPNASAGTGTNVWGELLSSNTVLFDAVADATSNTIATGLMGNSNRTMEITSALQFGGTANPDTITLSGTTLEYDVNTGFSGGFSQEFSLVFTAVPEPASLAIWGACSAGCVIAARRRKRKQLA